MPGCSRCQTANLNDARFCTSCGTALSTTGKLQNKSNLTAAVIALASVLSLCVLCGIIGNLTDKRKTVSTDPVSSSNSSIQPAGNTKDDGNGYVFKTPNPPPSSTDVPKTLVSKPTKNSKSAIIISENANLRDAPNASGVVLEIVPEGASVEVIKQKGRWFYVAASSRKGWMHGDTIRYENQTETSAESKTVDVTSPKPSSESSVSRQTQTAINNAGAAARCRDGSLSYSAHRRGTCSHHGGVAVWF